MIRTNDRIKTELLKQLMKDLKKEFPDWRRNPYFRSAFTWKGRIKRMINIDFPILYYRFFFR